MAWEITRSCNLACDHCRASALRGPYADEFTTEECFGILDQVLEIGRPIIILTGGEPLLRADIFDIAAHGIERGLRVVIGTNGVLLTPEAARRMAELGIPRVSISLDFPNAEEHDRFRGWVGAFDGALAGIRNAQAAGVSVQINSTITRRNAHHLPALLGLALEVGAAAFHPFMLVPTGRGKEMEGEELAPADYERTLNWIYDRQQEVGDHIFFKPTDVPHYFRVMKQREERTSPPAPSPRAERGRPQAGGEVSPSGRPEGHGHPGGMQSMSRGCLAGSGFFFVSHRGDVQGCGYLEVPAGNLREQRLTDIWHHSRLFQELRDFSKLKGKCGACEYREICGGCRARAYGATGDYLDEEPYCVYQPRSLRSVARATKG